MAAETSNPSQIIEVAEIAWESITPTIKAKMLWSDPAIKRRAQLTPFQPRASLSMHRHVGDELLYVIEGSINDESGTVSAGSVGYRPNRCVHSVTSKNGATVFAIITGGIEQAKEIGTAPPSQMIVLSDIPWSDGRVAGMRLKAFWSDPATKWRGAMARWEPGAKLPRQKHIGDELLFMIEGSNFDESGELRTGNVAYFPSGCTHTVVSKISPHRDCVRHRRGRNYAVRYNPTGFDLKNLPIVVAIIVSNPSFGLGLESLVGTGVCRQPRDETKQMNVGLSHFNVAEHEDGNFREGAVIRASWP